MALVIGLCLLVYFINLDGIYLADDDKGMYMYQAWRITLGEQPYRDFLTPQQPLFLYMGTGLMCLTRTEALPLRVVAVALVFGSGVLVYLLGCGWQIHPQGPRPALFGDGKASQRIVRILTKSPNDREMNT